MYIDACTRTHDLCHFGTCNMISQVRASAPTGTQLSLEHSSWKHIAQILKRPWVRIQITSGAHVYATRPGSQTSINCLETRRHYRFSMHLYSPGRHRYHRLLVLG